MECHPARRFPAARTDKLHTAVTAEKPSLPPGEEAYSCSCPGYHTRDFIQRIEDGLVVLRLIQASERQQLAAGRVLLGFCSSSHRCTCSITLRRSAFAAIASGTVVGCKRQRSPTMAAILTPREGSMSSFCLPLSTRRPLAQKQRVYETPHAAQFRPQSVVVSVSSPLPRAVLAIVWDRDAVKVGHQISAGCWQSCSLLWRNIAPLVWLPLPLPPDSPLDISRLLLQNVQELLSPHGDIGLEPEYSVVRTRSRGRRACRDGPQTAGNQDAVGGMRRQSLVGDGVRLVR